MNDLVRNSFVPPVEVWTAILAGLSITIFLLLFSRHPLKLPLVLKRYSAAVGGGAAVWFLLLLESGALSFNVKTDQWLALSAGALIYLSAIFCNYYLYLINAGFRIEMLNNLAEANREVTIDEWMALYGKGHGMYYFLEDRLMATLIPWKLATWHDNKIILTRLGQVAGHINSFLAYVFSER
jgi:hypothetical protein